MHLALRWQNVGFVNSALNAITADAFARFADAIEGGRAPQEVAAEALGVAWKTIFNGDGYSAEWRAEAERRGVWRIDSGVEAVDRLAAEKNAELFERLGVLSRPELAARRVVMLQHYAGVVEMEAGCMVDMIVQVCRSSLRVVHSFVNASSFNAFRCHR